MSVLSKRNHGLDLRLAVCLGVMLVGCEKDEEGQATSTAGDASSTPLPSDDASGGADVEGVDGIEEPSTTLPVMDPSLGFTLDEGEFTVQPNEEGIFCLRIPVPEEWRGRDLALLGWDSDLPLFTHHFFMSYSNTPLDSDVPVPCEGDSAWSQVQEAGFGHSDGKLAFGAGEGISVGKGLIDGYGKLLSAGGHFMTSHHVLNFSDKPIKMHGRFNIYVKDAAETPHLVNGLFCLNQDVEIPATSDASITGTCTMPFDLDLVMLSSHAHQYLQRFEMHIVRDGVKDPSPVYVSTDWDSPDMKFLDQPIAMKEGDAIEFTCHYSNPTDEVVDYGLGVYNEMCAAMNVYSLPASVKNGVPPSLGTIILNRDEPALLFDTTTLPISF
jgi:hypothetical protein